MCGILFTNDASITKERFFNALDLIKHRGPDKPHCFFQHNDYKMGHNRLSILDMDERSSQPFFSKDGRYVIIYNGEIYNFKELAKSYSIDTVTTSDTEVLLELYIRYGFKMLNQLNGMFSIVILDTINNQFFVARDRLGVKPLYYYRDETKYIFSSEVSAIINIIQNVTIDEIAIRQYRKMRSFFNERTIYNQIKMFPAGHYMSEGKMYRYWDLHTDFQIPPSDEELRSLIDTAIEFRKISDVSVGSYLSGGLDSTIVAGLSGVNDTWTIGFEDFNEFEWSTLAAECFQTVHHKVVINNEEFLSLAKEIVKKTKEPISVPNEVLLYKMTKEVKKKNTVILSGEGADELFFGYDRIFRWAHNSSSWDIEAFSRYYSYGSIEDIEIVEDAISPFLRHESPLQIVASFFQVAHLQGLLRRLDRATMLCGVEARGPFLDYRLVERLAGVSFEYKMEAGVVKAPLKRVFKDLLPESIIQRKKVGFPVRLEDVLTRNTQGDSYFDKWFEFNIMLLKEEL